MEEKYKRGIRRWATALGICIFMTIIGYFSNEVSDWFTIGLPGIFICTGLLCYKIDRYCQEKEQREAKEKEEAKKEVAIHKPIEKPFHIRVSELHKLYGEGSSFTTQTTETTDTQSKLDINQQVKSGQQTTTQIAFTAADYRYIAYIKANDPNNCTDAEYYEIIEILHEYDLHGQDAAIHRFDTFAMTELLSPKDLQELIKAYGKVGFFCGLLKKNDVINETEKKLLDGKYRDIFLERMEPYMGSADGVK